MSNAAWGQKSPDEVSRLIEWFFSKILVPNTWRYLGRTKITNSQGELLSEGCVFDDKYKSDMHYKITFIVAPERGALCEKRFTNAGAKYSCVVSNKTFEGINEFILKQY